MKRYLIISVTLIFCVLINVRCSKDVDLANREDILTFLEDKSWDAIETESGLFYVVDKEGAGGHPTINNTVTVHYRGYYLDEEEFDSSYGGSGPVSFPLKNVIEGWQEGIPLFTKGGTGKLLIPSKLGYGSTPPNGIRNNAVLVFEISLIDFK